MPRYNLNEYSDNYSDTSDSLWQFTRDKINNSADITNDDHSNMKQVLLVIEETMGGKME